MSASRAAASAIVLTFAHVATAAAFDSVDDHRTWAVTDVAVVDVVTGAVREEQTIVVKDGVIESVRPTAETQLTDDTLVVDASGRYAIPGLWDMHVHLRGGPALEDANERWLRQYLGYGVTSVRDAGGDLPDAVLRWKQAVTHGSIEGPRIFTSLRKIDGPEPAWPGSLPVAARADIGPALDELEAAGADFVKLYDGSFEPALYLETLAETERRGLRTAAHVPLSVPFEDAIDAGLDSVEHAFYLVKAADPDDRARSRRFAHEGIPYAYEPFFGAVARIGAAADDAHARRVFADMAERGVAITPTLYGQIASNDVTNAAAAHGNARLEAVPREIRATYGPGIDVLVTRTREEIASDESLERTSIHLTRLAAETGVTVLAGTDTGASNPLLYPGDSLHRELATLVDVGLSPLEALRAATVDAARWLGKADELGTIAAGKAADFVILSSNPLADIENTRSIEAVVQQGVYFDAAEIEALKTLEKPAAAD